MNREAGRESHIPTPLAHYAAVAVHDGIAYCSGSLGIDPETNEFANSTIQGQTVQALRNLDAVLHSVGSSLQKVLKISCVLARRQDFPEFDTAYSHIFGPDTRPARTTVSAQLLVRGALVELDAIAYI